MELSVKMILKLVILVLAIVSTLVENTRHGPIEDFQTTSHAEYQPQKWCCNNIINLCCSTHCCDSAPVVNKVHHKNIYKN
jgi:hypothetical protein